MVGKKIFLTFIFLLGVILFLPGIKSGFVYDDNKQIVKNEFLKKSSPLDFFVTSIGSPGKNKNEFFSSFYRPLPFAIYTIIYKLFGLNAFYFHLF